MQSNVHVVASPDTDGARKIASIPPPDIHSSVSKQTSGTLGSAAIDLSRYKSHNRTVTMAGVAMGMAVVIVGLVFAMRSSGSDASSQAKANATKAVAPAAVPAARPPTAEGATSSATPPMPSPVATNSTGPEASASPKSIAVSALPAAPAAPPIAAHPVLHPTPPKPIHSSKPKIDDGF
jgi:hypothetical protein